MHGGERLCPLRSIPEQLAQEDHGTHMQMKAEACPLSKSHCQLNQRKKKRLYHPATQEPALTPVERESVVGSTLAPMQHSH
eukprot:1157016-Pelagomonas_calceolata.AAC.6